MSDSTLTRKALGIAAGDRTKTDTGRQAEQAKAREITLSKELGKMVP